MANMGIWMVLPQLEKDQVLPRMPKLHNHYDPWMPVLPSPIYPEESFEEVQPLEEEQSPKGENEEGLVYSSPYHDSSSSGDPADPNETKIQVEDDTRESDPEPSQTLEVLSSTPSPSHQLFRLCILFPH